MESSSSKPKELEEMTPPVGDPVLNDSAQRYAEVFPVEIDCWCYGISNFPGELYPKLIYRVVKEMAPTFRASIDNGYVFDIFETAKKLFTSSRGVIPEVHVVYAILANLPMPFELEEESQFVLAQIIDQAEQVYGGIVEQMEEVWRRERLRRKIN